MIRSSEDQADFIFTVHLSSAGNIANAALSLQELFKCAHRSVVASTPYFEEEGGGDLICFVVGKSQISSGQIQWLPDSA